MSETKSIVVWLWSAENARASRREFLPRHVNALQESFERTMTEPHRFICVADTPVGLSAKVEWFKTPVEAAAFRSIKSPEGERFPSCYPRLWNFSKDAKVLGDRLLCLDIDLVVARDPLKLFGMKEDFVGWRPYRDWGRRMRYGGGIYLITPGTRAKVWEEFCGHASIHEARRAGYRGSDQAWISYKLGPNEPYWDKQAGIYSVRDLGSSLTLPKDARIVQFNGHLKPWDYVGRAVGPGCWVSQHWKWSQEPVRVPVKSPKAHQ